MDGSSRYHSQLSAVDYLQILVHYGKEMTAGIVVVPLIVQQASVVKLRYICKNKSSSSALLPQGFDVKQIGASTAAAVCVCLCVCAHVHHIQPFLHPCMHQGRARVPDLGIGLTREQRLVLCDGDLLHFRRHGVTS